MKYVIITYVRTINEDQEEAAKNMENKVQAYLDLGWQLCGGPSVDRGAFYQAVTYPEVSQ